MSICLRRLSRRCRADFNITILNTHNHYIIVPIPHTIHHHLNKKKCVRVKMGIKINSESYCFDREIAIAIVFKIRCHSERNSVSFQQLLSSTQWKTGEKYRI